MTHVEAASDSITIAVKVNRSRTPQQALAATGCRQEINSKVVESMPNGVGEEVTVVFFPSASMRSAHIMDEDLEKEYESRGLKPADPFLFAAVIEADRVFSTEMRCGTHWKDKDGKWCCAAVYWKHGERWLYVDVEGSASWDDQGWFAGVRK